MTTTLRNELEVKRGSQGIGADTQGLQSAGFARETTSSCLLPEARINLAKQLPLFQLSETEKCSPAAILAALTESVSILLRVRADVWNLCEQVLRANLIVEISDVDFDIDAVCAEEIRKLRSHLPQRDFASLITPNTLRDYATAITLVASCVDGVVDDTIAGFEYMEDKEIIGGVQYYGSEVVEVTFGRPHFRDREVFRQTSSETTTNERYGALRHTETTTTTTTHQKHMELLTSLRRVTQRLYDPVANPLPYRGPTPPRVGPLLASFPDWLYGDSCVVTASAYDLLTMEELLSRSKHTVTETELSQAIRRSVNRETLGMIGTGAAYTAGGLVAVAGAVAAVAAVGAAAAAVVAAAPVALPVAATAAILAASPDPAIVVGGRWNLSAWVPSEFVTPS